MKSLSIMLASVLALGLTASAHARAVSHEVTPQNIDQQPYGFKVSVKPPGDVMDFEIRVAPKLQIPGAAENGSLTVSACGKKKVATPTLTIVKTAEALVYTFRMTNRDLDRATTTFTYAVPTPGDYYRFNLDDFLPAEDIPPAKPTDGPKPTETPKPIFDGSPKTGTTGSSGTPIAIERPRVPSLKIRAAAGDPASP